MIFKILAVAGIHVGLGYYFSDVFPWYFQNSLHNPFYTFAWPFVALWVGADFVKSRKMFLTGGGDPTPRSSRACRGMGGRSGPALMAGKLTMSGWTMSGLLAIVFSCHLHWRGTFFAAVCLLLTSLISVLWISRAGHRCLSSLYGAFFFTLPLPYNSEILAALQLFTLRTSIKICGVVGYPLTSHGSLVLLKDGPVRIADACSGFQSLIVLIALAGLLSHLMKLNLAGRFLAIVSAIGSATGANILRVSLVLWIGSRSGVSTAMNFWHGLSAWLFYILALGCIWGVCAGLGGCRRVQFR